MKKEYESCAVPCSWPQDKLLWRTVCQQLKKKSRRHHSKLQSGCMSLGIIMYVPTESCAQLWAVMLKGWGEMSEEEVMLCCLTGFSCYCDKIWRQKQKGALPTTQGGSSSWRGNHAFLLPAACSYRTLTSWPFVLLAFCSWWSILSRSSLSSLLFLTPTPCATFSWPRSVCCYIRCTAFSPCSRFFQMPLAVLPLVSTVKTSSNMPWKCHVLIYSQSPRSLVSWTKWKLHRGF